MNSNVPDEKSENSPFSTSNKLGEAPHGADQSAPAQGVSVRRNYLWLSGLIIVCIAGIDQMTKLWAVRELSGQAPLRALGEFLRFTLVYNEGGAMGTNFGGGLYYLIIGVAILLMLVYYLWVYRFSLRYSAPLALIASGAVGNLIDRIRLGKVIDWIDVDFIDIDILGYQLERWWTFNIADASITLALLFMIWTVFTTSARSQSQQDSENLESESISDFPDVSATDAPPSHNP